MTTEEKINTIKTIDEIDDLSDNFHAFFTSICDNIITIIEYCKLNGNEVKSFKLTKTLYDKFLASGQKPTKFIEPFRFLFRTNRRTFLDLFENDEKQDDKLKNTPLILSLGSLNKDLEKYKIDFSYFYLHSVSLSTTTRSEIIEKGEIDLEKVEERNLDSDCLRNNADRDDIFLYRLYQLFSLIISGVDGEACKKIQAKFEKRLNLPEKSSGGLFDALNPANIGSMLGTMANMVGIPTPEGSNVNPEQIGSAFTDMLQSEKTKNIMSNVFDKIKNMDSGNADPLSVFGEMLKGAKEAGLDEELRNKIPMAMMETPKPLIDNGIPDLVTDIRKSERFIPALDLLRTYLQNNSQKLIPEVDLEQTKNDETLSTLTLEVRKAKNESDAINYLNNRLSNSNLWVK